MKYGADDQQLTGSTTIWLFPWMALLLAVAYVAALVVIMKKFFQWYARRRGRREQK
jgi:hypothetical protein